MKNLFCSMFLFSVMIIGCSQPDAFQRDKERTQEWKFEVSSACEGLSGTFLNEQRVLLVYGSGLNRCREALRKGDERINQPPFGGGNYYLIYKEVGITFGSKTETPVMFSEWGEMFNKVNIRDIHVSPDLRRWALNGNSAALCPVDLANL